MQFGVPTLIASIVMFAVQASADGFDPYKVPREQFQREVAVVALQPAQLPADVPDRNEVARRLERLTQAKLESKGYRVVAPSIVEAKWIEMSKKVGGVYDPLTGIADEAKLKTVREYTGRDLERTHSIDAFLLLRVTYDDMIPWSGGLYSYWKVGEEALTWNREELNGVLLNTPQRVVGTYLNAAFFDLAGDPLYAAREPIQWTRIYMARSYQDRPASEIGIDENRSTRAVNVVFGWIWQRP